MGIVFEDKELADQAVIAVEKKIHHEDMDLQHSPTGKGFVHERELV